MRKSIRIFVFAAFCVSLFGCLSGAVAGVSPRPVPINYYDPCTATTTPFYAYGWYVYYTHPQAGGSDTIFTSGGNTMVVSGGTTAELMQVLDNARTFGKKVVIAFQDSDFFLGVDPCTPSTYAYLAEYINAVKNHPALLGYLLGDENERNFSGTAQDIVNSAYVINNILDGHHQVWQLFDNWDGVTQIPYIAGTSVYSDAIYPNHTTSYEPADEPNSFLDMQNYLGAAYAMGAGAVANNASFALTTQGFGFDNAIPGTGTNGVWRLPSHREYRWNIFSAITAGGSRGTINWLFEPMWYLDEYEDPGFGYFSTVWMPEIAMPVFNEQEMLAYGMANGYNAGTVDANWTSKASDNSGGWTNSYSRITQLLVYDNARNKYFLIVTNNGAASQNVQFTISNLSKAPADVNVIVYEESDTSATTLTNLGGGSYQLSDTVPGFEVMIYRLNAQKSRFFIGDNGENWDTRSGVVDSSADSALQERLTGNTIDGNGISEDGLTHNSYVFASQGGGMWISGSTPASHQWVTAGTHWVVYVFDKTYSLDEMWIWNWNDHNYTSQGMKQVRILASLTDDEAGWTYANAHPVFEGIIPKADGTDLNPVNLVVDFAGRQAKYVLITSVAGSEHNWSGGMYADDGLSEVRFYYQPGCSEAIASGLGLAADLNGDCYVNFKDAAVLADEWLQCIPTQAVSCN